MLNWLVFGPGSNTRGMGYLGTHMWIDSSVPNKSCSVALDPNRRDLWKGRSTFQWFQYLGMGQDLFPYIKIAYVGWKSVTSYFALKRPRNRTKPCCMAMIRLQNARSRNLGSGSSIDMLLADFGAENRIRFSTLRSTSLLPLFSCGSILDLPFPIGDLPV